MIWQQLFGHVATADSQHTNLDVIITNVLNAEKTYKLKEYPMVKKQRMVLQAIDYKSN